MNWEEPELRLTVPVNSPVPLVRSNVVFPLGTEISSLIEAHNSIILFLFFSTATWRSV